MFVCGGNAGIDLLFLPERRLLKINDTWLNIYIIHTEYPCRYSELDLGDVSKFKTIFCDHIAEKLYGLAVKEVLKVGKDDDREFKQITRFLRYKVRKKLREMPRDIRLTPKARGITVSWCDGESEHFSKTHGSHFMYQPLCIVKTVQND